MSIDRARLIDYAATHARAPRIRDPSAAYGVARVVLSAAADFAFNAFCPILRDDALLHYGPRCVLTSSMDLSL